MARADRDYWNELDVCLNLQAPSIKREIEFAVKSVEVSTKIPSTNDLAYFNIETQEEVPYCVQLSLKGFRIVSNKFDFVDERNEDSKFYETIYSLLDSVSPLYTATFAKVLQRKLEAMVGREDTDTKEDQLS